MTRCIGKKTKEARRGEAEYCKRKEIWVGTARVSSADGEVTVAGVELAKELK